MSLEQSVDGVHVCTPSVRRHTRELFAAGPEKLKDLQPYLDEVRMNGLIDVVDVPKT